jgi:hypothetical protein
VRCASGVASAVHDAALLETEVNPEAETGRKANGKVALMTRTNQKNPHYSEGHHFCAHRGVAEMS